MEILFEIVFSIIFEGAFEGMKSKKVPLALRIICGIIFLSIFVLIIGLIGFFAYMFLDEKNYILTSIFTILDIFIIVLVGKEIIKIYKKN